LFIPSPDVLGIKWSHTILTCKFTLNLFNKSKFCVTQHSLSSLQYSRYYTDQY
jgi:hypothetical protein